ncbi:hypothetical protein KUV57_13760 [Epibacterium sp. DP7N7-1]|nr:hypothetical protein [Epibacterium sp. DP7N7-1]
MLMLFLITLSIAAGGAILWRICPPFKRWLGGDFNKPFGETINTYIFTDAAGERHRRDFVRPLTPIKAECIAAQYKGRTAPVCPTENVDN